MAAFSQSGDIGGMGAIAKGVELRKPAMSLSKTANRGGMSNRCGYHNIIRSAT